ncbi:MAG: Holliday junction branch migration protein RuvA [Calditrichia bacterium]
MIEQINGHIIQKSPTFCVVDCHGIGIGLHISVNTFQTLEDNEKPVQMYTYLHVREDALQLFGFKNQEERTAFRHLISISGVGPRLALTVLSGLTVADLRLAISSGDVAGLTRIPGVGKKTAQRVLMELKDKFPAEEGETATASGGGVIGPMQDEANEAILALLSLGYRQTEAQKAVRAVIQNHPGGLSLEELIKLTLKEF